MEKHCFHCFFLLFKFFNVIGSKNLRHGELYEIKNQLNLTVEKVRKKLLPSELLPHELLHYRAKAEPYELLRIKRFFCS